MSKTALQIVNSVLTRLREDTVTDFSDSYTQLILEFVNETLREVQSHHQWKILRKEIRFNTVASQVTYVVSGTVDDVYGDVLSGGNTVTEESSIVYSRYGTKFVPSAWIWPTTTEVSGDGEPLNHYTREEGRHIRYEDGPTGSPKNFYTYSGLLGGVYRHTTFRFIEVPTEAQLVISVWYVPAEDLEETTDLVQIPHMPIVLGAYAKALDERGEELGPQVGHAMQKYQKALDDCVFQDMGDETIIAVPE